MQQKIKTCYEYRKSNWWEWPIDTDSHLGSPTAETDILPSIRFCLVTLHFSFKKRRNSTSLPSCWSRTLVSKGPSEEPGAHRSPEVQETAVLEAGVADHAGRACSCVARVHERLHLCIVLQPKRLVSGELHAPCKKFWFQQHLQVVEQYSHRKTWRRCHHRVLWGTHTSATPSIFASPTSSSSSSW
jgi:hypothetical protein